MLYSKDLDMPYVRIPLLFYLVAHHNHLRGFKNSKSCPKHISDQQNLRGEREVPVISNFSFKIAPQVTNRWPGWESLGWIDFLALPRV